MKYSKAQIFSRVHKMPELRFEDQRLTSFAGLVIIQELFSRLDMKARLRACFHHLPVSPIFGHHSIVLTLIVHLMLGYRRLRDMDYYRDDLMEHTAFLVACWARHDVRNIVWQAGC